MHTALFVTPLIDPDNPVRGGSHAHLRALARRTERLVVITAQARGTVDDLDAEVLAPPAGRAALAIGSQLATVLRDAPPGTPVIVDDDLGFLLQAHAITSTCSSPLFWWCPRVPSARAATEAARWANGLLVAASPTDVATEPPVFEVGGGIELTTPSPLTEHPTHPPLRLIAIGPTAPHRGLPVLLRAVARARGRGTDARLLIMGTTTSVAELQHRRELEALVANLALSSAVRIDDLRTKQAEAETLRQAQVLVDAETSDDLNQSALDAMAAERIVLSSSRAVAPLLEQADTMPLAFAAGDVGELAERISALAAAWPTSLRNLGGALRRAVAASHSADVWADGVTTAIALTGSVAR